MPSRMKLTKNLVFLQYFSKFMEILLFVLKYMFISFLLKMINGLSWSANIMASPFNGGEGLRRASSRCGLTAIQVVCKKFVFFNLKKTAEFRGTVFTVQSSFLLLFNTFNVSFLSQYQLSWLKEYRLQTEMELHYNNEGPRSHAFITIHN